MKRRLFIGSSKEGLDIALLLKEKVDSECGDWIETEIWNDGSIFSLNKNALDSLLKAARKFDYGVLVASKDDISISRGVTKGAPRDNVLIEMGMFLGSLGLTRAFLLVEEETKLPSDYNGITLPFYNKSTLGSVDAAIDKIIGAFNGTKKSYNLKPMPSTALALGYFVNLIQPAAKKKLEENSAFKLEVLLPKNLKDVTAERQLYKNHNPSTEKGIYKVGERPTLFERDALPSNYWDVPTTLTTISLLMDKMLPTAEIGVDQERSDWINHELRNFAGTLNVLIQECAACRGNVNVRFLN
jgi:hypothetical protein